MGPRALIGAVFATSLGLAASTWWPLASHRAQAALAGLGVGLVLHGFGRLLSWRDRKASAAHTVALGLAAYQALGGWLAAAGVLSRSVCLSLGAVGLVAGIAWLVEARPGLAPHLLTRRAIALLALTGSVVAVAFLASLGAPAGDGSDGDGLLRGVLARLYQTGALDDGLGLPRDLGLGGNPVALTLGVGMPDNTALHVLDGGLGLALVFALLVPRVARTPFGGYGALVVVALILGVPPLPPDLSPRWLSVALLIALHDALASENRDHHAVLLTVALASLGHGGLAALAFVVATSARARTSAAVAAVGLAGYVLAAVTADGMAQSLPSFGRLVGGVVVALVTWSLASLATRPLVRPGLARWQLAIAIAIGAGLAAAPTYILALPLIAPYVIALLLLWTVHAFEASDGRRFIVTAIVFAAVLIPAGLRFRLGVPPRTWGGRWSDELDAVRASSAPAAPVASLTAYEAAQRAIPAGARVAVWVDAPEHLDYRRHAIIDLRSAAAAGCQPPQRRLGYPGSRRCRRLARQRATVAADYLIVSPAAALASDDPLARRLATGRPVSTSADLVVVALPPPPP